MKGGGDYWFGRLRDSEHTYQTPVGWHRWKEAAPDIRVINPPPPYFWLGREAEAL